MSEKVLIFSMSSSVENEVVDGGSEEKETLLEAVRRVVSTMPPSEGLPSLCPSGELPPGVLPPVRYRAPFSQVPLHDCRGDARLMMADNCTAKGLPLHFALAIGNSFVNFVADILHTGHIPFQENTYEALENSTTWCKSVSNLCDVFLRKIAAGEVSAPVASETWELAWQTSVHSERNRRPKMEDRHIVFHDFALFKNSLEETVGPSDSGDGAAHSPEVRGEPEKETVNEKREGAQGESARGLFAVFDGHGGQEAATYLAAHFTDEFVRAGARVDEETLRATFSAVDARLSVRCEREKWRCGSTAVAAALCPRKAAIAWCGDSAALLLTTGSATRISKPHCPNDPAEVKRVEAAGGYVVYMQGELRVNGVLNITRSLGDVQGRPMISPEPDIEVVSVEGAVFGLLLACDGVSDELNDAEIYTHIKDFIITRPVEEWQSLSAYLCEKAKDSGSTDNLTSVFVFLRPVEQVWEFFHDEMGEESEEEKEKRRRRVAPKPAKKTLFDEFRDF